MVVEVKASYIEELFRRKESLRDKVGGMLDKAEAEAALKDHHSFRKPIACGLTVHTGIGCDYGCLYCYVPDMGFPMKPRPYPLSGLQLVYALLNNPYFIPGIDGTLLAFGSVTEPFMDETKERAFEYLRYVKDYLGNPTQIATKSYLSPEDAVRLRSLADERLSVLVTITTIANAKRLEPNAPTPQERFETIRNLSRVGIHVALFLRPIIPSVTIDYGEVLKAAAENGAVGVVAGSLRVTRGILTRLNAARFNTEGILARLPHMPHGKEQVPIRVGDLKKDVYDKARGLGLKVYPSSCSANMDAHGLSCWLCKYGPCGDPRSLPRISEEDVKEVSELMGIKAKSIVVRNDRVVIRIRGGHGGRVPILQNALSTVAKRQVIVSS